MSICNFCRSMFCGCQTPAARAASACSACGGTLVEGHLAPVLPVQADRFNARSPVFLARYASGRWEMLATRSGRVRSLPFGVAIMLANCIPECFVVPDPLPAPAITHDRVLAYWSQEDAVITQAWRCFQLASARDKAKAYPGWENLPL